MDVNWPVLSGINAAFLTCAGQTDLPVEGLEAAIKSITLVEDFTAFDAQLPHPKYCNTSINR